MAQFGCLMTDGTGQRFLLPILMRERRLKKWPKQRQKLGKGVGFGIRNNSLQHCARVHGYIRRRALKQAAPHSGCGMSPAANDAGDRDINTFVTQANSRPLVVPSFDRHKKLAEEWAVLVLFNPRIASLLLITCTAENSPLLAASKRRGGELQVKCGHKARAAHRLGCGHRRCCEDRMQVQLAAESTVVFAGSSTTNLGQSINERDSKQAHSIDS
jgi:hypothetical protein